MTDKFVSEVDGEEITINHLSGEVCIVDDSIEFEVYKENRFNQFRLRVGSGGHYYVIENVYNMTAEGGYIVDIHNSKGEILYERTLLINKKLRRKR